MAKDEIIRRIRKNKPTWDFQLPQVPHLTETGCDLANTFRKRLLVNGVEAEEINSISQLPQKLKQQFPDASQIFSNIPEVSSTFNIRESSKPGDLKDLDLAVFEAELAVADNGAIWLSSNSLSIRAIPFITKYLAVLVKQESIVAKMHQAYMHIDPKSLAFGCFISGPSKTADIEQALVIGAHGPLGHRVFIL